MTREQLSILFGDGAVRRIVLDSARSEAGNVVCYSPSPEGFETTAFPCLPWARSVEVIEADLVEMAQAGKPEQRSIDLRISEIDRKSSRQLDAILHHPDFRRLESCWRGLKFLVDRTEFRQISIHLLPVSKDDLREDFERSGAVVESGLYKHVHEDVYRVPGHDPYGVMIADYEFSFGPQDIRLLQNVAAVAAMAHRPFIGNASSRMFGLDTYEKLRSLRDLPALFQGPQYGSWRAFRESAESRYVGVALPRFHLRAPYGSKTVPVRSFGYEEDLDHNHELYVWGAASFAFATRIVASFAAWRVASNCIGPESGGEVETLAVHSMGCCGEYEIRLPIETLVSERREYELSEEGFIALAMRKGLGNAVFLSANSCQKPREENEAERNRLLETRLPYLFYPWRFVHTLRLIYRDLLRGRPREEVERGLPRWLDEYVADVDKPSPGIRRRRPLRAARISVSEAAGGYEFDLQLKPHLKYDRWPFTLAERGRLLSPTPGR